MSASKGIELKGWEKPVATLVTMTMGAATVAGCASDSPTGPTFENPSTSSASSTPNGIDYTPSAPPTQVESSTPTPEPAKTPANNGQSAGDKPTFENDLNIDENSQEVKDTKAITETKGWTYINAMNGTMTCVSESGNALQIVFDGKGGVYWLFLGSDGTSQEGSSLDTIPQAV